MCTSITFRTKDSYFGRTLDLEYAYDEKITITPRNYEFHFRKKDKLSKHYGIIGMATVVNGYPLYYEAANEKGLAMAGLNFPELAHYVPVKNDKDNIAPFELIPWILSQCGTVEEARERLNLVNLCDICFSEEYPLSPLHWIIADLEASITVESVKDGLKIYENKPGVLTNSPTFDYHMIHLCDYMNVTNQVPENRFGNIELKPYSRGMGGMGIPGDLSSASRFVRAAFVKLNSVSGNGEEESVSQFFHILGAVEQQRGCVKMPDGRYEITEYTSCINLQKGIYYYTTYENSCISAIDMKKCDLEGNQLILYPLIRKQMVYRQN